MRNKYPGICYRCKQTVAAGAGHFERHNGSWRVQHAECAIVHRNPKYRPSDEELERQITDLYLR